MSKGVFFFNFGNKCALRMMVAAYTLRKHYSGNATVCLAEDEYVGEMTEDLGRLGVDVTYFPLKSPCKRNTGYTIKPEIINKTPYDITLAVDTDVVFLTNVDPLIAQIKDSPTLLTQFSNWISSGQRLKKRINSLGDVLPKKQIEEALVAGPAINTGVLGITKGESDEFMKDWIETTYKGKCRFIVDEIACQCMFFRHKTKVLDSVWNCSAVFDDIKKAKILHLHGRKHATTKRPSGRLWWKCTGELIDSGLLKHLDTWMANDKQVGRLKPREWKKIVADSNKEFEGKYE